jgi:hypothetical protein
MGNTGTLSGVEEEALSTERRFWGFPVNLYRSFMGKNLCVAVTAVLMTVGATAAQAQQSLVTDWTSRHVIFTNPGSEMDALMNGHRQEWRSFVNNPRYIAQQLRRSAARSGRLTAGTSAFTEPKTEDFGRHGINSGSIGAAWTSNVTSGTADEGTGKGVYPAVYTADFDTPSCTADYAVYPVNVLGTSSQPGLVVYNHLYVNSTSNGFCTGLSKPDVFASYYVYTTATELGAIYTIQGSPVISESGTQIAFVVNDSAHGYLRFYVITLPSKADGTIGAPTELTDAGTEAGASGAHGTQTTTNGTVSDVLLLSNDDQALTSPWVDFTTNTAYVASSGGKIYKIENVFGDTGTTVPTEVTTAPWPFQPSGGTTVLTSPVVDPQTGDIIVGATSGTDIGDLFCVTSAGAACGTTTAEGHFTVATSVTNPAGTTNTDGGIFDAPVVLDNGSTTGTTGWAFAEATYTTESTTTGAGPTHGTATTDVYAVLAQAPISSTGFGTVIGEDMGTVSVKSTGTTGTAPPTVTVTSPNLYSGDFDNEYYSTTSPTTYSGNLYFCGNASVTVTTDTGNVAYDTTPELWRIGFGSGTGNGSFTGSPVALYTLASNATDVASGCTPLTEFFNQSANSGAGQDYLFLGVSGYGAPTDCDGDGCVMNFKLPATGGSSLAPTAEYSLGGNGDGSSGIVIDNQAPTATYPGSSQIYFGNLQSGDSTGISQAGLD